MRRARSINGKVLANFTLRILTTPKLWVFFLLAGQRK